MRSVLLLLICLGVPGVSRAQTSLPTSPPPEPLLKAQFFERFTRFVDWPAPRPAAASPFIVCLAGGNAVTIELERLAARLPLKGRTAQIRRLGDGRAVDPQGCHAVYIAPSLSPHLEHLLGRTRGHPILTVADSPGFAERGVIINMFVEDGYVRFEVNGPAARAARLRLSSQLLRLARMVGESPG
jgi:hypothetical protein